VWWRDLIYSWFTMPWKKAITITQDMIFGSGKSASLSATASGYGPKLLLSKITAHKMNFQD